MRLRYGHLFFLKKKRNKCLLSSHSFCCDLSLLRVSPIRLSKCVLVCVTERERAVTSPCIAPE